MMMESGQITSDDKLNAVLSSLTQSVRTERLVLHPHAFFVQYIQPYYQYGLLRKLVFSLDPTNPKIVNGVEIRVKSQRDGRMFMQAPMSVGSDLDFWAPVTPGEGFAVELISTHYKNIDVQMSIFEYMCDLVIAGRFVGSEEELREILARVRFAGPRGQNQISQESLDQLLAMQRKTSEGVEFLGAHVQNMSDAIRKHLHEDHGKPLISQPPIGRTGNRVVG
jgi:hypothetical protein